ncbi:MAG: hypothetical protein ABI576_05135 [Flavobacterium sp.]
MKFTISLKIDQKIQSKSSLINNLSQELTIFFKNKNYGKDIMEIVIGFNCVKPPIGYEHLFKLKKPFYLDFKIIKNIHTGEPIELEKYYFYEIKIDNNHYDKLIVLSDEEIKKIIAHEILNSLSNLDNLPKKIKDFNREQFKKDLESYFKERELI